jgi:hypothetical protein
LINIAQQDHTYWYANVAQLHWLDSTRCGLVYVPFRTFLRRRVFVRTRSFVYPQYSTVLCLLLGISTSALNVVVVTLCCAMISSCSCGICDKTFCRECKEFFFCEGCHATLCCECSDSIPSCDRCKMRLCSNCNPVCRVH